MHFRPVEPLVQFDVAETSDDRFDKFIESLIIITLGFCPLAIGSVQAWSQGIFLALCTAMSAALAVKLIARADVKFVWSWAYLPIVLFILLAIFQLIPLPAEWVRTISPRTFERKTELLSGMPGAAERLKWMKLTFYPNATARDLRLLLGISALFVVTVNVVRRLEQVRKLVIAMAVIGGAFGLVALIQNVTRAEKIYGMILTVADHANAGPYINQNHAAEFYNQTLGAGLALLLFTIHRLFRREDYSFEEVIEKLKTEHMRWGWVAAATVALSAAAVALSLSRGGMISMLIAGLVTGVFVAKTGRFSASGWVLTLLGLVVTLLVMYAGFDALFNRLSTVADRHLTQIRSQILRDSVSIWKEYPVVGTGLGTHEVVYPAFSHNEMSSIFTHAENEYVQMLTETGLAGTVLIGVFLVCMAGNYVAAVRGVSSSASSLVLGLGCGVLAVLLQSTTDFAPHFPGVASWLAVSFALIASLAELRGRERKGSVEELPARGRLWMRVAAMGAIVVTSAWSLWFAYHAYRAEDAFWPARVMEVRLEAKDWHGSPEEYDVLLASAEAAVEDEPSNIDYGYWLNMYRWHAITQQVDPATGDFKMSHEDLYSAAAIVEGFKRLRWFAPTFGPAYAMAGQIEHFVLRKKESGAMEIRMGFKLAPQDAITNYAVAVLDAVEQNWDESQKYLERAIKLNPALQTLVIERLVRTLDRPDVAMRIVGDDIGSLRVLGNIVADRGKHPEYVERINDKILALIRQDVAGPKPSIESLLELARYQVARKEYVEAIPLYQRALNIDYSNATIHFDLATALAESGDLDAAMREIKITLLKQPKLAAAEEFMFDIENRIKKADREKAATQTAPSQ